MPPVFTDAESTATDAPQRAPLAAWRAALALLFSTAFLFTGCGGGGGDAVAGAPATAGAPSTPAQAPTTPAGSAEGVMTTASIGPAGGTLRSVDGALTLEVPVGALAQATTLSIQPIGNAAHGGRGRAFRISPEGLHSAVPMTLRFAVDDAMLEGSAMGVMQVATQSADGSWQVYRNAVRDLGGRTLSVQTSHFSDWAVIAGAQLRPGTATLPVGQSIDLTLVTCKAQPGQGETSTLDACTEQPVFVGELSQWSVSGVPGGTQATGVITEIPLSGPAQGEAPHRARFDAPVLLPSPNPVAVSVVYDEVAPGAVPVTLVSNILITRYQGCQWLRDVATLHFETELAYDFTGSGPLGALQLHQQGVLRGELQSIDQNDFFGTFRGLSTQGSATLDDRHTSDGVTTRLFGDGQPAIGTGIDQNQISGATFVIDYRTCTYTIQTQIAVVATSGEPGDVPRPAVVGGFTRGNVAIDEINGIGGYQDMPVRGEPDAAGTYAPGGLGIGLVSDGYATDATSGTAAVRWVIHRMTF
ncbi:MAG: hypothetical protein KF871_11225 [Hydrogenophaga sp.]|uniref:hypothetical protein n=1 Tax=Hydrogenophaga sp. TaxID=1904254 RepID=UPI001D2B0B11|nr:hypothetical protein [Hydrogenophaga sp.]MBX3610455.1 hypothetical protein [Hydrogenophaga sp.]